MLRVGLTGGLGSGKSTVAAMLAVRGAHVLSADDLGRRLMQPGEPVFDAILAHFGREVLALDGSLDRRALARLAFTDGRLDELNAIVHPAVIARQAAIADELARHTPAAILVVESALLFETGHAGPEGWRRRFDRVLLVTAAEDTKIQRFVTRAGPGAGTPEDRASDARARLARQLPDAAKAALSDLVIANNDSLADLEHEVDRVWQVLTAAAEPAR